MTGIALLGTQFEASWNDMPIPQLYATDPYFETEAVRYRAGLFDVTSLRLIDATGKDALLALNELLTSDIAKLAPGKSAISNIVDENGSLIDDVLVYCIAPDRYRISHGGGALEDVLPSVTEGRDIQFRKDNDTHILSLQGPKALDILAPHTMLKLADLGYFEHAPATLFGREVTLARGGYSGERGYEVFCRAADAVFLWDSNSRSRKAFRCHSRVVGLSRYRPRRIGAVCSSPSTCRKEIPRRGKPASTGPSIWVSLRSGARRR